MLRFTKRIVVAVLLLVVGVFFFSHLDFLVPVSTHSNTRSQTGSFAKVKFQPITFSLFTGWIYFRQAESG